MNKSNGLESDSKYRNYTNSIEKCLKSFEYSTEWADLISSLGRLIKLIQTYNRYNLIPKKKLLGKRLAQCLHPALPAGVHCKTLECYDLIFRIMGSDHLAMDIAIYSPGLFGLLGPSAMSVKPPLFDIFELYFLPLENRLRPAFVGLLQGLLPGLEEGAEFFDRGNVLIEQFCRAVKPEFFYTCMWQVLIQAPSIRNFGTAFILNHFNKRKPIATQASFFGLSIPIMIQSLSCLLSDTVVLVQRDTLDFLILALPLHIGICSKSSNHPLNPGLTALQMGGILVAALNVLLKRDASLNRRLFIWLLGSQVVESADLASNQSATVARLALTSDSFNGGQSISGLDSETLVQSRYFKTYGLNLLISALRTILQTSLSAAHQNGVINRNASSRPFRLMTGLLDRSEIGSVIIEHVLIDFIYYTVQMYHKLADKNGSTLTSLTSPSTKHPELKESPSIPQNALDMILQHQASIDQKTNTRKGRSKSPPLHQSSVFGVSSNQAPNTRLAAEDEFMRVAELFFSNLESSYLWRYLQNQFVILLKPPSSFNSNIADPPAWFKAAPSVSLRGWTTAVKFIIQHLPIDTYPGVRGQHLPEMVSLLTNILIEKLDEGETSIKLSDFADVLSLLMCLIGQIQEHMMTVFDQSMSDMARASSTVFPQTPLSPILPVKPTNAAKEAQLLACTVGDIRRLLGAFIHHFMGISKQQVQVCLDGLSCKNDYSLEDFTPNFFKSLNLNCNVDTRDTVIDLFAQLCRLVVEMCNVPLAQPPVVNSHFPEEVTSRFDSYFCSSGTQENSKDNFHLPDWISSLVSVSAFAEDFDLKAICMHTLLDLVFASSSIHGWPKIPLCKIGDNNGTNKTGLLLPVLSPDVLYYLANELFFFPLVGISMWFFFDASQTDCFEDAASLLIRLQDLSPPNSSLSFRLHKRRTGWTSWADESFATDTPVEDFIISQMQSVDPDTRIAAHHRFTLIWHLFQDQSVQQSSSRASVTKSEVTNVFSSWRRTLMGLPDTNDNKAGGASQKLQKVAFNRCLLILLDNLDEPGQYVLSRDSFSQPDQHMAVTDGDKRPHRLDENVAAQLKQQTMEWLSKTLQTGHVGRVVAPLFAALLHPNTARVSLVGLRERQGAANKAAVKHTRRLTRRRERAVGEKKGQGNKENDVLRDSGEPKLPIRPKLFSYTESEGDSDTDLEIEMDERRISAIAAGVSNDERQSSARNSKANDVFGDEYKPIDVMTNLQKDHYDSYSKDHDLSPDRLRQSIIQERRRCDALLTELLSPEKEQQPFTEYLREQLPPTISMLAKSPFNILPLHEHLLVYLHNFDFNQVLYALSRLRAILQSNAASQFILVLAASPTAHSSIGYRGPNTCGFPSLFGTSLADILARHHRSILATGVGDFSRQSTMDEIASTLHQRIPCLLDVLIDVCVQIMCSVLPRIVAMDLPDLVATSRTSLRDGEMHANFHIRLMAGEILDLIAKGLVALDSAGEQIISSSPNSERSDHLINLIKSVHSSRDWINAVIYRTHLPQSVLHSLGVCVELAHVRSNAMQMLDADVSKKVPICLRLLLSNGYCCDCCDTALRSELETLLSLTQSLLKLPSSFPVSTSRKGSPKKPSVADQPEGIWPWSSLTSSSTNFKPSLRRIQRLLTSLPSFILREPLLLSILFSSFQKVIIPATQPLLLSTLRLALCSGGVMVPAGGLQRHPYDLAGRSLVAGGQGIVKARPELHATWFRFLLNSLAWWGPATASMIHIVVSQLGTGLRCLTAPFYLSNVSDYSFFDKETMYPPDYTIQVLTCLQGLLHAFLLQYGQSKSSLLHGDASGASVCAADRTASSSNAVQLTKTDSGGVSSRKMIISAYYNSSGIPEVAPEAHIIAKIIKTGTQVGMPECNTQPMIITARRYLQGCLTKVSAMLTEIGLEQDGQEEVGLEQLVIAYVASQNLSETDLMRPTALTASYVCGRSELAHIFPTLLTSLAFLWYALNQSRQSISWRSPAGDLHKTGDVSFDVGVDLLAPSPNESVGIALKCGFVGLDDIIRIGHQERVRLAIDRLLEPIASQYPSLLIGAIALVWPDTLSAQLVNFSNDSPFVNSPSECETNRDLLWLLSSYSDHPLAPSPSTDVDVANAAGVMSPSGLPLTSMQCSLLALISGLRTSCLPVERISKTAKNGNKLIVPQFFAFSTVNTVVEKPDALLTLPKVLKTIKELIFRPPSSMPSVLLLPESSTTPSFTSPLVSPSAVQSALLHLLFAWISATGGVNSCFQLANLQLLLRDLVTVVSSSNIPGSPITNITSPTSVFLLLKIFNEIIISLSNREEKLKDQKEIQDICLRLLESTSSIAGSALEQATWFRRGLQVRTGKNIIESATPSSSRLGESPELNIIHMVASDTAIFDSALSKSVYDSDDLVKNSKDRNDSMTICYRNDLTIQALCILAEHMAIFLDVVYRSDEKDKIPSALNNGILTNILPFLKTKSVTNSRNFASASQVLATLSSYQFTRRAWRKEIFELFVDPNFFQMTARALHSWIVLVDNLMTQDKHTFKELLTRLTVSQGGGLNLFSSKDAEYEQRSQHLKKVNFVVFASEFDQYSRSVSELLERVTDNLRATTEVNVPIITQMFLCARVLVSRISPNGLASLWHIVIPELVAVFKNFADRCIGLLEISFLTNISQALNSWFTGNKKKNMFISATLAGISQPQLTLLLSACKLLATIVLLPEAKAPQLLFHRWVFVGGPTMCLPQNEETANEFLYSSILTQINTGLVAIYQKEGIIHEAKTMSPTEACFTILATHHVSRFDELEYFFRSFGEFTCSRNENCDVVKEEPDMYTLNALIEASLFNEFLEPLVA